MDSRRSLPGSASLGRRVHALVERYTPDGALGRFLLGAPSGTFGLWLLALVLFEIPRWGLSLAALFWTPVLLAFGLPMVLLSLLTLWPIYLSLIGNLDSTAEYPVGSGTGAQATESITAGAETDIDRGSTRSPTDPDDIDPFGDLKAKYESGELTEDEFERRLEERLATDVEGSTGARRAGTSTGDRERTRTPERN
ncbi:SHOCT domain-containing protein [Halopiger aswanensis]|uniref:Uncharacterized protein n=1 Tax=Halopiger aswanensis TaxID=148449 RepID=A0A3R7EDS5_9EURY|nr:SHOCT domain-containing protein [Halopiger aswanensis]RKD93747.1 hypothetical protein ATJ93_3379 [Halopiger aswanensis]